MTNTTAPANPYGRLHVVNTSGGPTTVTELLETSGYRTGKVRGWLISGLDFSVEVHIRRNTSGNREWQKNSRIYGALSKLVDGYDAEERRLFAAITNHTVKDPALAAFQRASVKTARVAVLAALPQIGEALHALGQMPWKFSDESTDVRFSKKAGCAMCACSPGFVVTDRLAVNGGPVDMWFV